MCLCSLLFAVAVDCRFVGFLEPEFASEFCLQCRHMRLCLCNLWFAVGLGLEFEACRDLGFFADLKEVRLRRAARARVLLVK